MRLLVWLVALALVGCGDDTTSGGGGATGGGGNPSTGGQGTGASANGGNDTGGGGDGTGGQMPECPAEGGDTECDTCSKSGCCASYETCLADESCAACFLCTQMAEDPTVCLGNECDVELQEEADLISCAYAGCGEECFGGQSICNPAPEDTPCVTCAKAPTMPANPNDQAGCCDELEQCVVDAVCLKCLGCVVTAKDPVQECTSVCQFGNEATGALLNCAAFPNGNCTAVCNP